MKLVAKVSKAELDAAPLVRVAYPPFDVVVARVDGVYVALEDACNHGGASLKDGWLERGCVVCPLHGYRFDMRTGKLVAPRGLCPDQRTFVVREGEVELEIWDAFELQIDGMISR